MVQLTPNHPYVTLRVKFKKCGNLQYISHLDLVRTMHKIIVRANLPLWYTQGFNPKPKMIFAAPLSIGTESLCEFVDIRLVDDIPPEVAVERLNANMAPDLRVLEAYYAESKLTDLKWLEYDIRIITAGADEALAEKCEQVLLADEVVVEKKTKPHEPVTTVDIRPLIKNVDARFENGEICLTALLSADASAFLNPEYIVKALKSKLGILSGENLTEEYYSILRTKAFTEDMSEYR